MYEKITSDNVIMFAIKNYNNPQCEGELEFYDDLKRFKYIKRLFKKYLETGELRERLLALVELGVHLLQLLEQAALRARRLRLFHRSVRP